MNAGLGLTPADIKRYMELRTQMLKAVVDADGLLLMGTDSPQLFMVPGFALHRELGIMASAGLTPYPGDACRAPVIGIDCPVAGR